MSEHRDETSNLADRLERQHIDGVESTSHKERNRFIMRQKKNKNTEVKTKGKGIRKLGNTTKLLPCKLVDAELLKYGNDLGETIQDILTEEGRQESLKKEMKATLSALEARRSSLASKITRKEEHRDIDVERVLNFGKDIYQEVRLDTGEIIFTRPVTDDERQEVMTLN